MRRIRAAQIGSVGRLVPMTMTINLINAGIVMVTFWHEGPRSFLIAWAIAIGIIATMSVRAWFRARQKRPREASANAIRRMIVQALILGLIWGSLPVVLFAKAEPRDQLILACLITGMISGGAFALSTVQRAGLAYMWAMVLCSAVALSLSEGSAYMITGLFLLLYAVFMSRNLMAHGQLFYDNLRAQLELERNTEIISLLLKDFQANASDWLWQTDPDGRLVHVPERFVEVAQLPVTVLHGAQLADVLAMLCPDDSAGAASVVALLAAREPLNEVAVHVVAGGSPRLWSLWGEPPPRPPGPLGRDSGRGPPRPPPRRPPPAPGG
ncbi:PAS domain-containing sensor histidine kinase, partial [Rhodopseudomonas sp. BAL398]|nr:PAS domain-containing sensor histidine kinase [Rhodopseudomonas sp. BAL398]